MHFFKTTAVLAAILSFNTIDNYTYAKTSPAKSCCVLKKMDLNDIKKFIRRYKTNENYSVIENISKIKNITEKEAIFKSLLVVLQIELGLTKIKSFLHKEARSALPEQFSVGSKPNIIKIVQAVLFLNGFNCSFNGRLDATTLLAIKRFQKFMKLSPTQRLDNPTLQAILASGGNADRPVCGCDCATQLTLPQIKSLKEKGYIYIGRYLTSKKRQKHLTITELNNLLSNGFHVILFFQEGLHDLNHCTAKQGIIDGNKAVKAARNLKIRKGTIYGVIDSDLTPAQVSSYLKNLSSVIKRNGYSFGVYGSRAICNYAYKAGIARYSYIAGLSHKYKGNSGHPMPNNWAFNQEFETTEEFADGTTKGKLPIDRVVVSGRDKGITIYNYKAR